MAEQTPLASDELLGSWAALSRPDRIAAFQALPREDADDDLFHGLSGRDKAEQILGLPAGEQRIWMRLLAPDDAADLVQQAREGERLRLLDLLDETTRREVSALLAYKDDAAGGLMNPRFARLRPEMSADEAISYLRKQGEQVRAIYYGYALDGDQRLLGIVALRDLFSADRNKTVREIMRTRFVSASEEMDQEALAALFAQHHLLAIPVIDSEGRMKGIVTVDDIMTAVQQEATEDIQKIGGMEALDEPYLQISFGRMISKRAGWLSILFLGEMLTATARGHFEEEIARAVVLALFVPLIISSGGNSGSQAATLVVRALALRELRLRDWWRVVRREIAAGLCLGLIPLALRRFGLDPATASAPFVATLVDVTGLVIYFKVASLILKGTLL